LAIAAGYTLAMMVCCPLGVILSWFARTVANGYEDRRRWANRLLWCHVVLCVLFVMIIVVIGIMG